MLDISKNAKVIHEPTTLTVSKPRSIEEYIPRDEMEKAYFDRLWDLANNQSCASSGSEELSGQILVPFFTRSGVDKALLKQVWSLSTPIASMTLPQFYIALRYIALIQNGDVPISTGLVIIIEFLNIVSYVLIH